MSKETQVKPRSVRYTCATGKRIEYFFFGALTRFVWNREKKIYEAKETQSHFLCDLCKEQSCKGLSEFCEFIDVNNIVVEGEA